MELEFHGALPVSHTLSPLHLDIAIVHHVKVQLRGYVAL